MDKYPDFRRELLLQTNISFKRLCDDFHESMMKAGEQPSKLGETVMQCKELLMIHYFVHCQDVIYCKLIHLYTTLQNIDICSNFKILMWCCISYVYIYIFHSLSSIVWCFLFLWLAAASCPSSTHGGLCLTRSLVQGGDPLRCFQWLHLTGGILYGTVLVVTWTIFGTGLGQSQVVFHYWRAPACHEEWILGGGFVFKIYYWNLGTLWYLSCRIVNLLLLDSFVAFCYVDKF